MMPPSRHMMNYSVNPSYHNTKTNEQTENQRTSFCLLATKGSITIEAAFAIPLFFLAVLALFYMMEVMSIRTSVRNGMQYAGKMRGRRLLSDTDGLTVRIGDRYCQGNWQ